MNKKAGKCFAALLLAVLVCALMAPAHGEGASVTINDMYARVITLSEPAERIVALTAADCEILYALGAGDTLVGRGEYCDYPPQVLDVPAVQSGAQTNVEQIIALEPQVVLMGDMAQSVETVEALENAGIQVVVSNADDLEGVYTAIRMIGALLAREDAAQALIAQMQGELEAVRAACDDTGRTVYFEVSPLQWGLWTAGEDTFMNEIAQMCGLTNAFADVKGWTEISEEQVLARDPDYIVTISMYAGEGPTPVEEIMCRAGWENLSAVENERVFNADSDEISRPGPRLADAAKMLSEFVRGAE